MIDKKKPMSFDMESTDEKDLAPAKPEMETEMAEESEVEEPGESAETATLSLEMLGGKSVNPGDTIRLEVVEVSPDDGTITVKYSNPKTGGIAKAAAAFNEGV